MRNKIISNQQGQSLIELLIAMAIFVLVVSSIMFLTLDSHIATQQGDQRMKASLLGQEAMEAASSIGNRGWKYLTPGSYGLSSENGIWELSGAYDTIEDYFTREIQIAYAQRDSDGEIVPSGGVTDYNTKKITSKLSWDFREADESELTLEEYLVNWRSLQWTQTTQSEFDQGSMEDVVSTQEEDGELQLATVDTPTFTEWGFDQAQNYDYDTNKIEFSDSYAQLKDLGVFASGEIENPTFDRNADPWRYYDWDEDFGEVDVQGDWEASGGGYISITVPRSSWLAMEMGGYWEQALSVTEENITETTVQFDWSVTRFAGNLPAQALVVAFVEPASGEPSLGAATEIWRSSPITGESNWQNSGSIDVSRFLTQPGEYYLKLAFWVEKQGGFLKREGPYAVGFDNAYFSWRASKQEYAADWPSVSPREPFRSDEVASWDSFSAIAIKNGGEVEYQLSDDAGVNWYYWDGAGWSVATGNEATSASVVDEHIDTFPVTSAGIMVKAFLLSDGSQRVKLDAIRISYQAIQTFDWTFDRGADYIYEPAKIRVNSSRARLIGPDYPTDAPSIEPSEYLEINDIVRWEALEQEATTNGGQILYQLSDTEGEWYYWNGTDWQSAGETDRNTITEINDHLSSFPVQNKKLKFRAYLVSDGTQEVILDNVTISYVRPGGTAYYTSGTFESNAFDTTATSLMYNYLAWEVTLPAGSTVTFQMRTADTESNLAGAQWVGPDGTEASYYEAPGQAITVDPSASGQRWIQYKAYLSSNGVTTPRLEKVMIDYEIL